MGVEQRDMLERLAQARDLAAQRCVIRIEVELPPPPDFLGVRRLPRAIERLAVEGPVVGHNSVVAWPG